MSFVVPPDAKSWVEVAQDSHFPIQNLPAGQAFSGQITRIGDHIVDVVELSAAGLVSIDLGSLTIEDEINRQPIAGVGSQVSQAMSDLRREVFELLKSDNGRLRDDFALRDRVLRPVSEVTLELPIHPPAFVDFYSGINHAENVGRMFRPDQPPLLPNYRHIPIGYNGRASSVVVSGTDIRRPSGQQKIGDEVEFGPTKELDFELEMGFFTAKGNEMGVPIPVGECEDHILGLVLVNDWSARDVQRWEYQPLGPFLSKSFGTSISPWLVTLDALEPFRIQGMPQDPEPLPHLRNPGPAHYDINLEVYLQTQRMTKPQVISRSNTRHLYWSFIQQLAHQTSNGTPIDAGDLYASGTISGTEPDSFGSMLELCWKGTKPMTMEETGETRTWLEDGDTVIMTAWCQGDGYKVGFGECRGTIVSSD